MNPAPELVERYLSRVMSTMGLDVEYDRAAGDLAYRGPDATPTVDVIGGYGSLIFGHNHPEITGHAKALLDAQTPVHAQFSRRTEAENVAATLNRILARELPVTGTYSAIFANTGAEAIEAAMKHAELERVFRLGMLAEQLGANAAAARAAVEAGAAKLSEAARQLVKEAADNEVALFDALAAELGSRNAEQFARQPIFFALQGGFHGKLVGSLQLTHNPQVRTPFQGLGATARFLPLNDAAAARAAIDTERGTVYDVMVTDGLVDLVELPAPVVCGFLLEPVQGEGGVRLVDEDFAATLRTAADELGVPVIVDEVQSGAGRTGAFFASSHLGLVADYYVLAKAIGGGLAKTSVVLVRTDRYVREFDLVHSSTFARDGFSCGITAKVLELLEAEDGAAYRKAAERGAALTAALQAVADDFADVVLDVRGTGLLVGFEFQDQSAASSAWIRDKGRAGLLGYALAGYLLAKHDIRIAPTASAPNTLRLEPSINLTDEQIAQLAAGFRDVCDILRHQDALRLVHPLTGAEGDLPRAELRDHRITLDETAPATATVAYLGLLSGPQALRVVDPSLADLDDAALTGYLDRVQPARAMAPFPALTVGDVDIVLFPLLSTAEQVMGALTGGDAPSLIRDIIGQIHAARGLGFTVIGLDPTIGAVLGAAGIAAIPGVVLTSGTLLPAAAEHTADLSVPQHGFGLASHLDRVPSAQAEAMLLALNPGELRPGVPLDPALAATLAGQAAERGLRPAG